MKDAVIEIKMTQHRPRKPVSVEYTTDEEDIIVYDMGEEMESPKNGSTVGESKKDIAKYTGVQKLRSRRFFQYNFVQKIFQINTFNTVRFPIRKDMCNVSNTY
ncbi:hypothetical protein TNCV_219181 [Trichonephila clavipes]|nr:hypothetical protein TNCV_219181 [Trichonephila clavipes]